MSFVDELGRQRPIPILRNTRGRWDWDLGLAGGGLGFQGKGTVVEGFIYLLYYLAPARLVLRAGCACLPRPAFGPRLSKVLRTSHIWRSSSAPQPLPLACPQIPIPPPPGVSWDWDWDWRGGMHPVFRLRPLQPYTLSGITHPHGIALIPPPVRATYAALPPFPPADVHRTHP